MANTQRVDAHNRLYTQTPVRQSIVDGYAYQGGHIDTSVNAGDDVNILIDASSNTYNGAYKLKPFVESDKKLRWTLYEDPSYNAQGTDIPMYNFNRNVADSCDISFNYAPSLDNSGNTELVQGYVLPATGGFGSFTMSGGAGDATEYSIILNPAKAYLLQLRNMHAADAALIEVDFRVTHEPEYRA